MTWWYPLPSPRYLLSGSPAGRKGQVLPGHGAFVSIVIVVGVIVRTLESHVHCIFCAVNVVVFPFL